MQKDELEYKKCTEPVQDAERRKQKEALREQLDQALLGRQPRREPQPASTNTLPPAEPDRNVEGSRAIARATSGTFPANRCVYCGDPAELVCDDCDQRINSEREQTLKREQEERERRRAAWFTDRIPELYRATDELLLPKWAKELIATWNPQDRYGATIVGPSNTSKTRTAVKLLEKAYIAGRKVEFRQAGDLRRDMNRLSRDGKDSELLREIADIEVLVVDDLGNQAWTEASEEFFLALFEARSGKRHPTIITSQFPSDELVAKLSNRRIGQALARRVGPEFNWIASSKEQTTRPPATCSR